jgi:hypothetical protein
MNTPFSKFVSHPLREFQEVRFSVVAACDSGLVCDYQQQITQALRRPTEFVDTFFKLEMLSRMHITPVGIDNSVSVQEQCLIFVHILFDAVSMSDFL